MLSLSILYEQADDGAESSDEARELIMPAEKDLPNAHRIVFQFADLIGV